MTFQFIVFVGGDNSGYCKYYVAIFADVISFSSFNLNLTLPNRNLFVLGVSLIEISRREIKALKFIIKVRFKYNLGRTC